MKNKSLIPILLLLFTGSLAYALEDPFLYVSLGYGRGWFAWSCVTEQGVTGDYGSPLNYCNTRYCPFESAASIGENNCFDVDLMADPDPTGAILGGEYSITEWGAKVRLNIPEDYKLVTSDGRVVGDELCVNDQFSLQRGAVKGEYYHDGGHEDTPSIYWVDDVEAIVDKLMEYHDSKTLTCRDIASEPEISDGFVDPVTGIPVYSEISSNTNTKIFARLVCSLKEKTASNSGVMQTGGFYEVAEGGTAHFEATYDVECMYYYYGGDGKCMQDMASGNPMDIFGHDGFVTLRLPMVLQARPLQEGEDTVHIVMNVHDGSVQVFDFPAKSREEPVYGYFNEVHNIIYNSVSDFFKVGEIGIKKDIRVIDPGNAKLEVSFGSEDISYGTSNNLRVLVTNAGDVDVQLIDVSSNVDHNFISCDSDSIGPGETSECLISVKPLSGEVVKVNVNYGYSVCGREELSYASKAIGNLETIKPSVVAQVYHSEVYGCEQPNDYYGCGDVTGSGKVFMGYKCYKTGSGYYTPTNERVNLKFDISRIPADVEVLGARLYLDVFKVDVSQETSLYAIEEDWEAVDCVAGGDICTQPYCGDCASLYKAAGEKVSSLKIVAPGIYDFDVSDYLKSLYVAGEKLVSFQLQGSEDLWSSEGESTCSDIKSWETQHGILQAGGLEGPYLEVLYRSEGAGATQNQPGKSGKASTTSTTPAVTTTVLHAGSNCLNLQCSSVSTNCYGTGVCDVDCDGTTHQLDCPSNSASSNCVGTDCEVCCDDTGTPTTLTPGGGNECMDGTPVGDCMPYAPVRCVSAPADFEYDPSCQSGTPTTLTPGVPTTLTPGGGNECMDGTPVGDCMDGFPVRCVSAPADYQYDSSCSTTPVTPPGSSNCINLQCSSVSTTCYGTGVCDVVCDGNTYQLDCPSNSASSNCVGTDCEVCCN